MPTLTTDDGVRLLGDFLHRVETGRWGRRDARAAPASIWGPNGKP